MKCKNCDAELTGRQKVHCSDRCRKALSRTNKSDISNSDTEVGQITAEELVQIEAVAMPGTLGDYYARPSQYAQRTNPDKLNWGPYMTTEQLADAGLKANRVSIPGDWDYEKVA